MNNWSKFLQYLSSRLPSARDIFHVYSMINFLSFIWMMFVFLYRLPGWILFLTPQEISVIFSYGMIVVDFDIVLFLAFILVLSFILPKRWLRDTFGISGNVISAILFLLVLMLDFESQFFQFLTLKDILIFSAWLLLVIGLIVYFVTHQLRFLGNMFERFSIRTTIFVYISVPVSALSLLLVAVRYLLR